MTGTYPNQYFRVKIVARVRIDNIQCLYCLGLRTYTLYEVGYVPGNELIKGNTGGRYVHVTNGVRQVSEESVLESSCQYMEVPLD